MRRGDGRIAAVVATVALLAPSLFGPVPANPAASAEPRLRTVAESVQYVPLVSHRAKLVTRGYVAAEPVAEPSVPNPSHTPVLFLHGALLGAGCVGTNPAGVASALQSVLRRHHWTGRLLPVDYYCGDSGRGTVDIRGRARPTADTSITEISRLLAWYVYRHYSSKHVAVDIVGHSMGGLIMVDALKRVGQRGFPPYLLVRDAVTISAPFGGIPARKVCPLQCRQMEYGSGYLAALNHRAAAPHGSGGTQWTVLGGSPCDYIPAASTLALRGALAVDFASSVPECYTHVTYLADSSARQDLRTVIRIVTGARRTVTGPHALEWVYRALLR
jgi:pimeloyl-ACP methyl ester carboxylesterase